ncbi:phage tail tape measure protein [Clostridium ihumii]|uniref:phage tail tape measure protein n=1 Tax=Clostridium ihumii TaxID=1470356 RepID=UPI000688C163|nr:phage tail tape measure protein [Clostridium ihumii]
MASTVKTTISIGGVLEPSVQAAFNKISQQSNNIAQKCAKVAKVTGGAVAAGVALATKSFANLEQATANVSATLGKNSTPQVLEAYNKKAVELSDTMSKSSTEVMEGFNYLALAGWSVEDSLQNVGAIVKSSVVSGMELGSCSDKVTDSLSALGLSAKDTASYTDLLALAQTKGNATFENLLDSLLASGGTFNNFKIPLNETVAILDKLADQGLKGSEAGNAMNSIFTNMLAVSGQAKEGMTALGVSMFDEAGKTRNMATVIAELNEKLSGCTEQERDTYIAMIAGKNHLDDFNKLLATSGNGLVDLAEDLKDTEGALDKAAMTIDDTILGKFKILWNTIINTGNAMVKEFAPNIKSSLEKVQAKILELRPKLIEFATSIKSTISDFIHSNTFETIKSMLANTFNFIIQNAPTIISTVKRFIPLILGIGSAMATLKIASKVSGFMGTISKIGGAFSKISFAFKAVAGGAATLGQAMRFLMGPIGWIALAIGAIVAIVTILWNRCEPFREMVCSLVQQVSGWIQGILLPVIASIGEKISNLWNSVLAPFLQFISGILQPVFTIAFTVIGSIISTTFGTIGQVIQSTLQAFGGIIDFITGVFTGNWSLAWQGIQDIFGGIFNGLISLAKAPLNAIIGLVNKAIGGINSLGSAKLPKVLGGGTVGINIPEIPMLARGGITNIPSICGEAGPEAVIPLKRNNPRSLSLLEKTAGAIGAKGRNNEGHTFVFAPNISGNVTDDEIRKIREEYEDFKEWVLSVFDDERRTDFA